MLDQLGASVLGYQEQKNVLTESYANDPVIKRALANFNAAKIGKFESVQLEDYLLNHSVRQ
jgi:hypothetical protein